MSSSGLIYAGIVGAWAVYLVPVWLRREEQLNEARQKARYAAAIRTLGRTEQFEKRWLAEETLAATGTDGPWRPPPETKQSPAKKAAKNAPALNKVAERRPPVAGPTSSPLAAADTRRPKAPVVSSRVPQQPSTPTATTAQTQRNAVRRRGVLLMRRRRAVAFLFTLATAGALVSAALGIGYIWAMLAPAALFSVYIVNIRRDERTRAEERYRRRQAALAAERRRERERQRVQSEAAVEAPVTRFSAQSEDYRRAANG